MACLCDQCAALCCRYFALPIDNPENKRDYDNIRWYLLHEKVVIFIESKQWYIGILNRCRVLQDDNRCGIYLDRPAICRSYTTDHCDYHAGDYGYEQLFTSADAFWTYAQAQLKLDRKRARTKSKARASRATHARRLSAKLTLPADVLKATQKPSPPASRTGFALPLLQS